MDSDDRPSGLAAVLDRLLSPTVLRLLALVAAPVLVVAVAARAEVFTAGWGAAVVGSLTLAASLFSAAAASASVHAGGAPLTARSPTAALATAPPRPESASADWPPSTPTPRSAVPLTWHIP